MGYMKHNTIVVTSYSEESIEEAHAFAKKLFDVTTPTFHVMKIVYEIIMSSINRYYSFFIAPDGSKEEYEKTDKKHYQS